MYACVMCEYTHAHALTHKRTQNLIGFCVSLLLLFQKGQTPLTTKDICRTSKYIIFIEVFGGRNRVISDAVSLLQALRYQGKSSIFQFIGICQDSINSFSLDSSSVQDFSLWGTSLYLPINLSYIREFSSAMNQSRFLCFSSPPSSSPSPSSSFHHNHMYGFSSLFFIKCFHLIFVSIHNNGFT